MNNNVKELLGMLNKNVDNYDHAEGASVAPSPDSARGLRIRPGMDQEPFESQFDVQVLTKYFTVAAGVYTEVAAAAINAALKTKLAAFIFGPADYAGGFSTSQGQFPLQGGWAYDLPFVYGVGAIPVLTYGVPDATAKALLQKGDMVLTYSATVGGVNYQAFVILRCGTTAYGKLLMSLNSDRFWLNNILYQLPDTSAAYLAQFQNQVFFQRETLYGKFQKDAVSPNSYKDPYQFQNGIIKLRVNEGFDKNGNLNVYVKYDVVDFTISVFVSKTDKILA